MWILCEKSIENLVAYKFVRGIERMLQTNEKNIFRGQ